MLAGHETTATLLSWTFYQLAADAAVQSKLRSELQEYFAGRDELDFDELSSLPYLDAVIKETLRFNSPVPSTVRVCDEDHVIPLSKAYPTQNGKSSFNSIVIKKGAELFIPIYVVNTSEDM
jgi:cytochrome P450